MSTEEQQSSRVDQRLTPLLLVAAVVSATAGLLYGYDTGIISGALLQISEEFEIGHGLEQVIAASILLGAVLGALGGSRLSELRGRRPTILIIASVFAVGAVASALSPDPWTLALSRVVLGLAVGAGTQTVPMYVAELAPPKIRGRLVLTFQLAIGVGILVSTIVGASEAVSWRISIGAAVVPALAMLALVTRLPESPRWLVKQGEEEGARDALRTVRPDGSSLQEEIGTITAIEEAERDAGDRDRGWRGLRRPWVRPALVVGCGIAIFTQLSGIEMIIYYSPTILTDNGFSTSTALQVSVGLGATYLVMMIVGLLVVDRVGRRRLTLIMVPGAALSLFVLGLLFVTGHSGRESTPFIVACLIVFMFFNAGGLQLMGWLTGSEIYPLAVRSAGTSIQAASLWGSNLLITLTLLSTINLLGVGPTMWMYALFNVAAWLFVFFRMPELTGHSLEEIEQHLRDGEFAPSDFAGADRS